MLDRLREIEEKGSRENRRQQDDKAVQRKVERSSRNRKAGAEPVTTDRNRNTELFIRGKALLAIDETNHRIPIQVSQPRPKAPTRKHTRTTAEIGGQAQYLRKGSQALGDTCSIVPAAAAQRAHLEISTRQPAAYQLQLHHPHPPKSLHRHPTTQFCRLSTCHTQASLQATQPC